MNELTVALPLLPIPNRMGSPSLEGGCNFGGGAPPSLCRLDLLLSVVRLG